MLDTNIVSNALRYPNGRAANTIVAARAGDHCVSIITAAELRFGAAKLGSQRLAAQIDDFLSLVVAVPMNAGVDVVYAGLRADLERKGTIIGPHDLFIAAHALALDLTLVTDNTREFSRVPGLRLENWLD